MKEIALTSASVCFLIILGAAFASNYMGMEPRIVKESDIDARATSVEDTAGGNDQIIRVLLGTEDTAGQFTMFSDVFPTKGSTVPTHSHNWHDEAFYVIRGRFEVTNGSMGTQIVGANTVVFTPRGEVHGWKSLDDDSKIIVIYTPGGWEHFYEALQNLTPEQREDRAFMKEFMESYDELF